MFFNQNFLSLSSKSGANLTTTKTLFLNDSQPPPLRFCQKGCCCCKRDGEEDNQTRVKEEEKRALLRLKRFCFSSFRLSLLLLLLLLEMATVCALERKVSSSFRRVCWHNSLRESKRCVVDPPLKEREKKKQ